MQTIPLDATGELSRLPRRHANGMPGGPEVITITEDGHPVLAVLPWEVFESLMETLEVLSDPEAMAAIRVSNEEAAAGQSVPWEQVKAELGLT